MAEAVAKGASGNPNITVDLAYHINAEDLEKYDAILIGAPTYRAQMPLDFKNLFEEAKSKKINLQDKVGAAFGSYGWSGEATQAVIDMLKSLGLQVIEPPIRAKLRPDEKSLEECFSLGKTVASKIGTN
jgi:flavorubredoxin